MRRDEIIRGHHQVANAAAVPRSKARSPHCSNAAGNGGGIRALETRVSTWERTPLQDWIVHLHPKSSNGADEPRASDVS
jgi:hypothetical protein